MSEVRAYLRERDLSLTDAVRDWYATEIEVGESYRLEQELIELEEEHAKYQAKREALLRRIKFAKDREERIRNRRQERERRARERRV